MRPTAPAPGYSGTPLAKKLGIKEGSQVHVNTKPGPATDLVHLFVTHKDDLARHLATLRHALGPSAMVWVSWPKKSAKVPTDVTEDTIRELALPLGFVDVKVCAVSAVWSGLKLVVRKALR
jgi:Protein of unknown function (DUF3052)